MTSTPQAINPVEIDTELARIYGEMLSRLRELAYEYEYLHYGIEDRKVDPFTKKTSSARNAVWRLSDAEAMETAAEMKAQGARGWNVEKHHQRILAILEELAALSAQERPLEQLWEAHRWSRFFLVPGGHIHSSQRGCHSVYATTLIGWLPELSGRTEAEAVAEQGALLCTHCYPSAPLGWTNGKELEAEARKAKRCPGSGTYVAVATWATRYVKCPECGTTVSRTPTGLLRAHDPKKGKR